jgi:hypothetical protein
MLLEEGEDGEEGEEYYAVYDRCPSQVFVLREESKAALSAWACGIIRPREPRS